jgi:hypothetical protein
LNKKEYDKAIGDYIEAIKLNPTQPIFYVNCAKAYLRLGNEAKAAIDEKSSGIEQ